MGKCSLFKGVPLLSRAFSHTQFIHTIRSTLYLSGFSATTPWASQKPEMVEATDRQYSRMDGLLTYRLASPARVHIQAGMAMGAIDMQTAIGPMMKTIADSEPRGAGKVIEQWRGYDELGNLYIPGLPKFVVSIFAQRLPDNVIITGGNHKETFRAYAARIGLLKGGKRGKSRGTPHNHYGLNALQDHCPTLKMELGVPAVRKGLFHLNTRVAKLHVSLTENEAKAFLSQPTTLRIYVDERKIRDQLRPGNPFSIQLPAELLTPGVHVVTANWDSDYGPVGIGVIYLRISE